MKNKLILNFELPTLNQIINESKQHWAKYSTPKKKFTELVRLEAIRQGLEIKEYPANFIFSWYRKNKRTDKDNIIVGQKYILDGLVLAELLPNDGWEFVGNLIHHFQVDKDNPRVEVEII